jgi:drug/metabolite transporter (DMT)-like permease
MAWERRWFQYAILLFLAFIWGSSFILMKVGLKSFSSPQVAAIRMLSASLVLLPLSIRHLKGITRKELFYLLIAGFIGSFLPAFLFTKAQTRIDSALAGMLNSLTPVFTLLIGLLFHRTKTRWMQVIGVIIGLIGAMGIISSGETIALRNVNSYAFFIVAATTCYAINVNVVKTHLTHLTGMQITSISFFFIGPAAAIALFTSDLGAVETSSKWPVHLVAISLLGVVGTALAMVIMNSLIRYTSAVFAASVTYIIPIFAIMWGLLDNEVITILHLGFMGLVLFGVYLISRRS